MLLFISLPQVCKLLGKGSYGKVYKVQRGADESHYALKECDLGSKTHAEVMDAVNEVRLLVSINHPSVVSLRSDSAVGDMTGTSPRSPTGGADCSQGGTSQLSQQLL